MSSIILFDGVCNFCNRSIQFIIKRDQHATFQFASLQSDIGRKLVLDYDLPTYVDSVILIEDELVYMKSTAVLKICKRLNRAWGLLYIGILVPRPIRDFVYDYIANHRYQWFGKATSCIVPSKEIRKRFLD
ncbi:thiol-disulfide oxidoreductase DCC family protein [Ectobacillus sp. sgz5001026]|uniref:thiol-disulfide oxidoreductase DCC family protein n=1 Tax=Ectobacillus sp. sgz5001026 TaxID=3242473 RepID=UPI0036D32957